MNATRFRAVTATHTPGSLELNSTAKPAASETVAAKITVVDSDVAPSGGKQPLQAPQSISVSIAANGKETDQFAGAKCAATKNAKSTPSSANLDTPVKEKRGRPGRPPKNAQREGKDNQDTPAKQ